MYLMKIAKDTFVKKYYDESTKSLTTAGRKLLNQLKAGIRRILSTDWFLKEFRSAVTNEEIDTGTYTILSDLFDGTDIQNIYNYYTNETVQPWKLTWHHNMFFDGACEEIWDDEKDFLKKILNNTSSNHIQTLNTAIDVFHHFDNNKNNVSKFIVYYISKSTNILPRIRQLAKNKVLISNITDSIIDYFVNNHLFDLDAENIALINKLILPYINSQLAITNHPIFALNNNEFIKLIKDYSNIELIALALKQLLNRYNSNITNNQVDDIAELQAADIMTGKSVRLSSLFYDSIHKITVVPVLYVNGNFLKGTNALYSDITTANENVRQYHMDLAKQYLANMNMHKNDIVHKTLDEWRQVDVKQLLGMGGVIDEFPVSEGVLYNDICVISYIPSINWTSHVIAAYKTFHPKNLFIQSDTATDVTRLAKLKNHIYIKYC